MGTDVIVLARRAVSAIGATAWRQGRVQLVLQAVSAEAWAVADEEQLWQALVDLLHSAVRRTLPGGVVVVSVEGQAEKVLIRVQDSGAAVRPASPARAQRWIEEMSGTLAAERAEGEGNCFSIALPHIAAQ